MQTPNENTSVPEHAVVQPIQEPLENRVLFYLRETFADDPSQGSLTTEDIAGDLGVPVKDLFDPDLDTGALFVLRERGDVHRYGNYHDGYSWMAAGGSIVWN